MVDIVARTNLLPTPELVVYRDAAELDIVARTAFNAYPNLNAYGGWRGIPPGSIASTPTIIVITIGRTTEINSAFSLNKVKKSQFGLASISTTSYSLAKVKRKVTGNTADVASAQALSKVKLGHIGNTTEINTAYALVFTVNTGTGPSIQYRRYLFSPLLRKSTNRYPLGTMK